MRDIDVDFYWCDNMFNASQQQYEAQRIIELMDGGVLILERKSLDVTWNGTRFFIFTTTGGMMNM